MVAPMVPVLGRVVTLNFARSYLFRAADALDRGDLIAAGCLLREAVRRQCWAECEWFDCFPQSPSLRTPPVTLLMALKKAGRCGKEDYGYDVVKEMIDLANKAAHCQAVKASEVRCSITMFHNVIDSTPCLQPVNLSGKLKPEPSILENADYDLDDCDDDDGSGWWKPSDWTPGGDQ